MAKVDIELSSTIERFIIKGGKAPWKWTGSILLTELTVEERVKLNLPPNGGKNDVIVVSGSVENKTDKRDIRKAAIDELKRKADEILEKVRVPKRETAKLPTNETCKDVLTTVENLNAKPVA